MKLSDAIRIGSSVRPRQIKGNFLDGEDGACGYGMALIGIGESPHVTLTGFHSFFWAQVQNLRDRYRFLGDRYGRCTFCESRDDFDIAGMVGHLNDRHEYTVEQLCAFVDQFDPIAIQEKEKHAEDITCQSR